MLLTSVSYALVSYFGYERMLGSLRRDAEQRLGALPARLDQAVHDTAAAQAATATQLAAALSTARIEGQPLASLPLPPAQIAALDHVDLFLPYGQHLSRWPATSAAPRLPDLAVSEAMAQVRDTQAPVGRLGCALSRCYAYAFVPAVDRDGRAVVVQLARDAAGALDEFCNTGSCAAALLVPAGRAPDAPQLWGRAVLAGARLPPLQPLLPELERQNGVALGGGVLRAGPPEHNYWAARARLRHVVPGMAPEVLLLIDRTNEATQQQQALRRTLLEILAGFVVSALGLAAVLGLAMRRLARVTRALPLLAEHRYRELRERLADLGATRAFADEINDLCATALALSERLQRLHSAEAESEAKSRFLATVSHEVRTPMNAIVGMAELLSRAELPAENRWQARLILDSGRALLRVIDDILDYSKLEAGRLRLEHLPLQIRDVVEGAAETVAPVAAARGLKLIVDVEPGLPPVVGDAARLRQVLLNLCSNAIKFTERGHVLLRVAAKQRSGDRLRVRFAVFDTGVGIPAAVRAHMFEPYRQADASTARRYGGTGLGLSICRALVTQMGGEISVRSKVGSGSEFWFSLPFEQAAPAPAVERPLAGVRVRLKVHDGEERAALTRYFGAAGAAVVDGEATLTLDEDASGAALNLRGEAESRALHRPLRYAALVRQSCLAVGRAPPALSEGDEPPASSASLALRAPVLVAEDHPANQIVIVTQLRRLGLEADVAADGAQALQLLRHRRYALLVTDLNMPGIGGVELAREIRRREAAGEAPGRLPIIALTASAGAQETDVCREAGIDDYIIKPASLDQLRERLQRWTAAAPAMPAPAAEAMPPGRAASFDLEVLHEMTGRDAAVIGAIARRFAEANDATLVTLRSAVGDGDRVAVQAQAHRLKGSAASVGAVELAERAAALEEAAAGEQTLQPLLDGVEQAYRHARDELRALAVAS